MKNIAAGAFGKNQPRKMKVIPSAKFMNKPMEQTSPFCFLVIKWISGITTIPGKKIILMGEIDITKLIIRPIFERTYLEEKPYFLAKSFFGKTNEKYTRVILSEINAIKYQGRLDIKIEIKLYEIIIKSKPKRKSRISLPTEK